MGINRIKAGLSRMVEQYKYALLVLLLGLGLMLLPTRSEKPPQPILPSEPVEENLEQRLSRLLSGMEGAGQVEVLLTEKNGPETLFQTNSRGDSEEGRQMEQQDTVLLEDNARNQSGLVRRRDPPRYLGALVVCQGAEDPKVRLHIVEAVGCVTGLRSDQIRVVKMK